MKVKSFVSLLSTLAAVAISPVHAWACRCDPESLSPDFFSFVASQNKLHESYPNVQKPTVIIGEVTQKSPSNVEPGRIEMTFKVSHTVQGNIESGVLRFVTRESCDDLFDDKPLGSVWMLSPYRNSDGTFSLNMCKADSLRLNTL